MPQTPPDRRHFQRFVMRRPVRVDCDSGPQQAALLDISLKGALISLDGDWRPQTGNQALAHIQLGDDDGDYTIEATVKVAHVRDRQVGLEVVGMDLESASTLRRLVELNLADPALLERELEQLTATG